MHRDLVAADLIALMDKYGIGTDATHAEHIEKIKVVLFHVEVSDDISLCYSDAAVRGSPR